MAATKMDDDDIGVPRHDATETSIIGWIWLDDQLDQHGNRASGSTHSGLYKSAIKMNLEQPPFHLFHGRLVDVYPHFLKWLDFGQTPRCSTANREMYTSYIKIRHKSHG